MKVRRSMLKDTVIVRTRTGDGAYGPVFADALTLPCGIDDTRRLVRDANGDEAVAELTLHLHPRTRVVGTHQVVDPLEVFTPETQVEAQGGRLATVISARAHTARGYVTGIEVTCS